MFAQKEPPAAPTAAASLREARLAWPGVRASDEGFAEHVAGKAECTRGAPGATLRLPELFLAYACSKRDPVAIRSFEAAYFDEVDAAARRFSALPVALDDVRQRVREKLFLEDPPALLGYAGTGELRGWVRALVLHMLLNIASREAREEPTASGFFDAVVDTGADAETAYLKQACRDEFQEAFVAAVARLTDRDKTLLQYAFADGLTVDEIADVFGVHRATAARWVASAKDRLVGETRADLMARLCVDEKEALSILRVALSRMGTTLLRHLG